MAVTTKICRCISCLDKLPPDGNPIPHSMRVMVVCESCSKPWKSCNFSEWFVATLSFIVGVGIAFLLVLFFAGAK